MQEGTPPRLAYRVIDANTGAVVVGNLAHLHQSTWTVRALQSGYPGSTTIGDFRILLPAPYSEEGARYRDVYKQLAIGQKVEGFLGDAVTGSPRVSGVITKLHKPLGGPWEVTGSDTLWWLQQSQLLPGETLQAGLQGSQIIGNFNGTQEVEWDDDFSKWNSGDSANYSATGWTFTSADPSQGFPAMTSSSVPPAATAILTTVNFWNLSEYQGGSVSIQGTMVAGTDTTTDACEASILILSDASGANGIMLRAVMVQTGTGSTFYNVHAQIYTISAGAYTLQNQVTNVFTNVGATFPFEVTAVAYQVSGTSFFRVLVNGKDPNCFYSTTTAASSGAIGLRFLANTGGSPTVYVNRIHFRTRNRASSAHRFAPGTVAGGSRTLPQNVTSSSQTHLDMALLASALDGWWIRKNPGFGYKSDSLDYAASPGTDLSSAIVFEEAVNVLDQGTEVTSVADIYATDVKTQALPGTDGGGNITWRRVGASGDMALTDSAYDVGVPTYALLRSYAQQIQARKTNPMQAIQVTAVRTAETADKWRELDFVTVHIPTLGVNRQKAQVVGYTLDETKDDQTVFLNQFPERHLPQAPLQRIVRPLDYLTGR